MAELAINQLIKIILAAVVITVVAIALYFFFRNQIISFFKNLPGEEAAGIILSLVK